MEFDGRRERPASPTATSTGAAVAAVRRHAGSRVLADEHAAGAAGREDDQRDEAWDKQRREQREAEDRPAPRRRTRAAAAPPARPRRRAGSAHAAPPIAGRPTSQRPRVITPRSTAASRSASAGRTRAARRAASQAPQRPTTSMNPAPIGTDSGSGVTVSDSGASPLETIQRPSSGPPAKLASAPATPPREAAAAAASRITSRRTCRGVAPTARNNPSSRRRNATENANDEAITNTATKAERHPHQAEQHARRRGRVARRIRLRGGPCGPGQHHRATTHRLPDRARRRPRPDGQRFHPRRQPRRFRVAEEHPHGSTRPTTRTRRGPASVARSRGAAISPGTVGGRPEMRRAPRRGRPRAGGDGDAVVADDDRPIAHDAIDLGQRSDACDQRGGEGRAVGDRAPRRIAAGR